MGLGLSLWVAACGGDSPKTGRIVEAPVAPVRVRGQASAFVPAARLPVFERHAEGDTGPLDHDGDGLVDPLDPCPSDPYDDADGDGVCMPFDLCPKHPDPEQLDGDGDGVGDACDACPLDIANDSDHDKVCDSDDTCPGIFDPAQADFDLDGLGDVCDPCPRGGDEWPGCAKPKGGGVPEILSVGAPDRYRLIGAIVTPGEVFDGEVLVVDSTITCVDADCSAEPKADEATVIQTHGLVFPGLIDAHNHILYDVFDGDDWTPAKAYENHNQWPGEDAYQVMQDAYDYLISNSGAGLKCEVLKYGELKALVAGTTSVLGSPKGSPQKCYQSLARSIDGQFNDLPKTLAPPGEPITGCTANATADHMQVSSLGVPTAAGAQGILDNIASCKTWSYVVHVAEGIPSNASAFGEWEDLLAVGLDVPETTIVHGTALGTPELQHMADQGMKLVWSPRSNISLYGFTTPIDLALQVEPPLVIALAPDWSMGGSVNQLEELSFARDHAQASWGGQPTDEHLVRMVTSDAAKALGVDGLIGTLEPQKLADLVVVQGDPDDPWGSLIDAGPAEIRMVMVGGAILVADVALEEALATPELCEAIALCGEERLLCAAEDTDEDGLDQTLAEIEALLTDALATYDADTGTAFTPLAPLTVCE